MAISDDFSGTLAKWTPRIGTGWAITSGTLDNQTSTSTMSAIIYTDEAPGSADQWAKVQILNLTSTRYFGVALRFEDVASPDGYAVTVRSGAATDTYINIVVNGAYSTDDFAGDNTSNWVSGDYLGASIEGQDSNIVVKIWQNPVGATPADWGTAMFTHTITGTKYNTANNVGIAGYGGQSVTNVYDNFEGGALSSVSSAPLYSNQIIKLNNQ